MSLENNNILKSNRKRKNKQSDDNFNAKNAKTSDEINFPHKKNKSKKVHKWPKKPEIDSRPKTYDIEMLEEKIAQLETIEDPPSKIRKKLRQLNFLHKKITQMALTQQSLALSNEIEGLNDDHETLEEDKVSDDEDIVISKEKGSLPKISAVMKAADSDAESDDDVGKGLKRFVVFVGNLPKDIKEDDIKLHFSKVGKIKSIRIPNSKEFRKNGFAFIELEDNITYEKTLSMHHTMLNNRRINVMYTNPDGKNLDKQEIQKKNAKLDALRKAGKLAGSIPEHQRRSFRRKKKRLAEEKATKE